MTWLERYFPLLAIGGVLTFGVFAISGVIRVNITEGFKKEMEVRAPITVESVQIEHIESPPGYAPRWMECTDKNGRKMRFPCVYIHDQLNPEKGDTVEITRGFWGGLYVTRHGTVDVIE